MAGEDLAALVVPPPDVLRDADRREQFLAEVMAGVGTGTVKTKIANCLCKLAKELRDNTDVRGMTRELDEIRVCFKEVLRRKGKLSKEEIGDIFTRVALAAAAEEEG